MHGTWKALMLAGATALISGCDNSEPPPPAKSIVVRSEAQEQLHKLDDLNRAIGLKRAILDSGNRCRRVDSSGYVQEHGNLSMWTAKCDGGTDFAIFVGPDGSAQVRRCDNLAQYQLPACVVRQPQPPATSG
jgi:hypothetical protein